MSDASLAQVQRWFHALVTAPETVERTVQAQGKALEPLVHGDERLSAVKRLDVYANMYFFRILDVLRDAYPGVVGALGDAAFHDLATGYLMRFPPAHPSIVRVGERLPAYLAERQEPALAALARLEWTYVELFDGPDAQQLTLAGLRALGGDVGGQRLTLIPCHAVLDEADGVTLVWRPAVDVFHRQLDDDEASLLRLVRSGPITIAELCERAAEGTTIDAAARRVFDAVHRWVNDGLLRA